MSEKNTRRASCTPVACSDSASCPPILTNTLTVCCSRAATLLPAKLRRRRGCGTRDSNKYWLNIEACGLLCASMTWAIVLYCELAMISLTQGIWYANSRWLGNLHLLFFTFFAALALASHARAMLSNPGACPQNSHPTTSGGWLKTCQKCDNHKPARAHHCSICGRCIIKMGE